MAKRPTKESNSGDLIEMATSINDFFRCFICMQQNAHFLCPHCSKLCCFVCISRWLNEQRQCPHCRATLSIDEIINCRWLEDVASQVQNLQELCLNIRFSNILDSKEMQKDQCSNHKEKLSVYCSTCKCCICHKCALWGGTHSGHSFKQIEMIYENHISQVRQEIVQIKERSTEMKSLIKEIEQNVEIVRNAKDEKVKEIRNAVETMVNRLDGQLKARLLVLMRQKKSMCQEVEQLDSIVQQIDTQLNSSSKSEIISKTNDLLAMIQQIKLKPVSEIKYVESDFVSEIVPEYESGVFVMEQFSRLQHEGLPVFSEPLISNGLQWRLKVYPNGNGAVRNEYLSVFLELTVGYPETCKYEYRVQMIHQTSNKIIQREFVSDFEVGECWGYNRFFRLDLLASEGYLNLLKDSLELRFQVRPSTYFQRCRDKEWFIGQLLKKQNELKLENDSLREKIGKLKRDKGEDTISLFSLACPQTPKSEPKEKESLSLPLDTIHENDVDCAQNLLSEANNYQSKSLEDGAKSVLDTLVEPPSAVGACAYFDTSFLFNNNENSNLYNLDDEPSHRLNRFIENMRLSPDYKLPNILSPKRDPSDDKNRNINREFNNLSSLQHFNIPKKREGSSSSRSDGRTEANIKWNDNLKLGPGTSGNGNGNLKASKSNPLDYDRLKSFNFWTKVLYSTSPSCESINQNDDKRASSENTDEENSKN